MPQSIARYVNSRHPAAFQIWRPRQRRGYVTAGKDLRVDLDGPARVRWSIGGRRDEALTTDSKLGLHTVRLPLASLAPRTAVRVRVEPLEPKGESKPDAFIVRMREGNGDHG